MRVSAISHNLKRVKVSALKRKAPKPRNLKSKTKPLLGGQPENLPNLFGREGGPPADLPCWGGGGLTKSSHYYAKLQYFMLC